MIVEFGCLFYFVGTVFGVFGWNVGGLCVLCVFGGGSFSGGLGGLAGYGVRYRVASGVCCWSGCRRFCGVLKAWCGYC